MSRKFILLLISIIACIANQAQTTTYHASEVTIKAPGMFAGFSLLDFNLGFPTLSFSGGADLSLYTAKRISGEIGFRYAYFDMTKKNVETGKENTNKISNYSDFRAGFRIHLIDREGSVPMNANISTTTDALKTTVVFLPVDVPTRKITALHLGFQQYNTGVHVRWPKTVTAQDGTGLSEWQSVTMLHVGMIYAGISFVDIMRATINSDGAKWKFKWYRDMYFDVLYGVKISLDDVVYNDITYSVQGDGASGYKISPYGVRFGYANMSQKVYLRYEIGWFPGLAWKGLFTQATMGFSIVSIKK